MAPLRVQASKGALCQYCSRTADVNMAMSASMAHLHPCLTVVGCVAPVVAGKPIQCPSSGSASLAVVAPGESCIAACGTIPGQQFNGTCLPNGAWSTSHACPGEKGRCCKLAPPLKCLSCTLMAHQGGDTHRLLCSWGEWTSTLLTLVEDLH